MVQLIINGLIAGSTYALIALGFSIIYRTVRFFNFAHGVVYAAGAYFTYTLAISLGLHFLPSFFLPQPLQRSWASV
jgi:branched-chain amino acid transport system permease protein